MQPLAAITEKSFSENISLHTAENIETISFVVQHPLSQKGTLLGFQPVFPQTPLNGDGTLSSFPPSSILYIFLVQTKKCGLSQCKGHYSISCICARH